MAISTTMRTIQSQVGTGNPFLWKRADPTAGQPVRATVGAERGAGSEVELPGASPRARSTRLGASRKREQSREDRGRVATTGVVAAGRFLTGEEPTPTQYQGDNPHPVQRGTAAPGPHPLTHFNLQGPAAGSNARALPRHSPATVNARTVHVPEQDDRSGPDVSGQATARDHTETTPARDLAPSTARRGRPWRNAA